ncbi:uncharacterized protein LOC112576078 [Pomacea canaliculata]|uniref:uncharacterized protein LOC112576078 n=1 Tax=Pomacea canaliculata TaxID=400727 RepID=UPI000D72DCF9|nr:uncharacterized protein LOC112576078 [Pomacea canaliculata]
MAAAVQGSFAFLCLFFSCCCESLANGHADYNISNQTTRDGAGSYKSRHDFSSVGIIVVIVCTSVGGIGLIYALLYLCKVFCCDKNIPPVSIMIDPDEKSKDGGRLTDPPPLYDVTVAVQPFSDSAAVSSLSSCPREQPDQQVTSCQLLTQAQSGRAAKEQLQAKSTASQHSLPSRTASHELYPVPATAAPRSRRLTSFSPLLSSSVLRNLLCS